MIYEPREANAAFCAKCETSAKSEVRGGEKFTLRAKCHICLTGLIKCMLCRLQCVHNHRFFWHGNKDRGLSNISLTWDQASFFVFFFCFFDSRGKKNNAWYIYLTSSQPPPNLHDLPFAWPVMFLANKRLPNGNQILARIMSLLKSWSVLGEKKFFKYVRVQMALRKK